MQQDGVSSSLVIPCLYKLKRLLRTDAELKRIVPSGKPGEAAAEVTIVEAHMPQAAKQLRRWLRDDFAGRFSWSKLSVDWLVASCLDPRTKVLSAYGLSASEVSPLDLPPTRTRSYIQRRLSRH
jgi:hypothetical protein